MRVARSGNGRYVRPHACSGEALVAPDPLDARQLAARRSAGFRNRDHRIHSSGDYKHRPPDGEHAPLHDYQKARAAHAVVLPGDVRSRIGEALREKLGALEARVLIVAVSGMHAHLLAELDADYELVKRCAGQLKQRASHVVRARLPGKV